MDVLNAVKVFWRHGSTMELEAPTLLDLCDGSFEIWLLKAGLPTFGACRGVNWLSSVAVFPSSFEFRSLEVLPGLVGVSDEWLPSWRVSQSRDVPVVSGPVEITEVTVKLCSKQFYEMTKEHAYKMSKRLRGKCIIFNMEEVDGYQKRYGTRIDGRLLKELFQQLYFKVEEIMNPTAQALKQRITELSQDVSLERDECLVLFVLSHGTSQMVNGKLTDCILGSDGLALTSDEILSPLTNRNCRYLRNKPRLAFFQACRGDKYDAVDATSEPAPSTTETDYMPQDAPSYADFLIGFPTQRSYRSFRNIELGSWYINSFIRICMNCACSMDICAMLNKLNGEVSSWSSDTGHVQSSNKTQIAIFHSSFRHPYFYFFPGIIE